MADTKDVLRELAEDMRRWAGSCREIGDSYDEDGKADMAQHMWGKAKGYTEAAEMLEREARRG